jgi:hypothetical protein
VTALDYIKPDGPAQWDRANRQFDARQTMRAVAAWINLRVLAHTVETGAALDADQRRLTAALLRAVADEVDA